MKTSKQMNRYNAGWSEVQWRETKQNDETRLPKGGDVISVAMP